MDMLWNFLMLLVIALFCVRFLGAENKWKALLCGVLFVGVRFAMDYIPRELFYNSFKGSEKIVYVAVNFLFVVILLRGSLSEKFFAAVMAENVPSLVRYFLLTILNNIINRDFAQDMWMFGKVIDSIMLAANFCNVFFVFLLGELLVYLKRRRKCGFHSIEWAVLAGVFFVAFFVQVAIWDFTYFRSDRRLSLQLITWGAWLAVGVMMYLLFRKIVRISEEKRQLMIDQLQLEQYRVQLTQSEQQYEEMQLLRHDMKNHLQCIAMLIQSGEYGQAQGYVEDMMQNKLNFGYAGVRTGHRVVDVIANTKLSQCISARIRTTVSTSSFVLDIDDVDLCIILGNLFDNAIEACTAAEGERSVFFEMAQRKGYVNLVIRNSIADSVLEKNPALRTTKADGGVHGIGLQSVRNAVQRCGGMIELYEKNGQFTADVWLPSKKMQ